MPGASGTSVSSDYLPSEVTWPPAESPFQKELEAAQSAFGPLEAMLHSRDPFVRKRGLEGIALSGEQQAVTVCVAFLADPDAEVRMAARTALDQFDDGWVAADIRRILAGGGPGLVHALDYAIPSLKGSLEQPFLRTLDDPQEPSRDRVVAAYCLGRMGSRDAIPALTRGAWSSDKEFSEYCAYALSSIIDPVSVQELAGMSNHPNQEIRWAAIQGLGTIGGPKAFESLRSTALGQTEKVMSLRQEAMFQLARSGDLDSIPVIMEIMGQSPTLSRPAIEAMKYLTGLDLGPSTRAWRQWYETVKREFVPPPLLPVGYAPLGFPQDYSFLTVPTPTEEETQSDGTRSPGIKISPSNPQSRPTNRSEAGQPAATPPSNSGRTQQPDMPESMKRALERLSRGEL
ncbi:MAG: hypothetical protein AMXMBFR84_13690 [Candidatus Hydrogenedentota bacterium]